MRPAEQTLVMATRSEGKLRELAPLLESHGWTALTLTAVGIPVSPAEEALEVHPTFEENALAKARYFAALTGRLVVADDSGLVVAALGGQPGIHSKRWSGSALEGAALDAYNNAYLQARLAEAAAEGRTGREGAYVCAAACAWRGGEVVVRGETRGRILAESRGVGGFGYDPYFWSDDLSATFAEVEREAKARVSHRGRAFRALFNELESFFAAPVDPGPRQG
jgi:XTP/dITP diphosphohydrolase